MAYTTAAELKAYLGISGADDDTLLTATIARAQSAIDRYTGRTFEYGTATERLFDASPANIRGPVLWLDRECCVLGAIVNGDGVTVSASEYVTRPRNDAPFHAIQLKSSTNKMWTFVTDWEEAISVTAKWSYSTVAPDDIAQACIRWAAFMYRQKDAQMLDITAIDAGVAIRPVSMPGDVRVLLDPYRRVA